AEVTGCGKGARVAAITVDLVDGTAVRVVNVHGSSGIAVDDQACRVREFTAVFEGLDGQAPLVSSELPNVVMGDLNVDPARLAEEQSGAAWNALTTGWTYLTEVGEDTPATYADAVSIDHVVSDAFSGSCVHPGVTPGTDDVFPTPYFDHHPALCDVVR
ncbi:MAG: hypothetical protein KC656_35320, partial [Myxococcales bacterium]|nr:hypothetical protein [Myxococcales bacterium]